MTALLVASATPSRIDRRLLSTIVRVVAVAAALLAIAIAVVVAPAMAFFASLAAVLAVGLDHVGRQAQQALRP